MNRTEKICFEFRQFVQMKQGHKKEDFDPIGNVYLHFGGNDIHLLDETLFLASMRTRSYKKLILAGFSLKLNLILRTISTKMYFREHSRNECIVFHLRPLFIFIEAGK